jgi:hypothetical protein
MTFNSLIKSATLLATLFALVSCGGQKPMVDDIKITPHQVDGDIFVSLTADLSIGNVQLPNAGIPIILPRTGKEIGLLTLQTTSDGRNQIHVELNVSETANLNLEKVKLPNGSMLPLVGENQVLKIPLGGKLIVYLSLGANNAALGVSIPIKTFDAIGKKVGTASLMPMFNKNGVVGAAGVYTSKTAGLNGFALVADLSSVLNLPTAMQLSQNSMQLEEDESSRLDINAAVPSRRQEKRINRGLLKLHKARKRLQLN